MEKTYNSNQNVVKYDMGDKMLVKDENFEWNKFLQPYELAVEDFMLKMEGIKKQFLLNGKYCPIEIVTGRVKTPNSILDKATRMGIRFEEIDEKLYDIGGIRITCKFVEDIYMVADLLKARKDIVLREERDYVKNPKPSGYRSLHLLCLYNVETFNGRIPVILEFQIRTHAMHFWATIEHSVKYKFSKNIPENIRKRLLIASRAAEALDNEMSSIRDAVAAVENGGKPLSSQDPYEREVQINTIKRW